MTITAADLQTLTIAYQGQPFVYISVGELDTHELDTAYLGKPFVAEQISGERETEAHAAGTAAVLGQSIAAMFSDGQAPSSATVVAYSAAYMGSTAEASGVSMADAVSAALAGVDATSAGVADVSGSAVGYRFGDMKKIAVGYRFGDMKKIAVLFKEEGTHIIQQQAEQCVMVDKKQIYVQIEV